MHCETHLFFFLATDGILFAFSSCINIYEPPYDKTNKMACAPSEDSDQPGHLPSLIRAFAFCMKKAWVLSYSLSAQRRLWSLGRCLGWSETLLGAYAILLVLSQGSSYTWSLHARENRVLGQLNLFIFLGHLLTCTKMCTVKFLKIQTPEICCNHPKIRTMRLYNWEMCPKDIDGIANSVDPHQIAPRGAVWSEATLFAQTYLSERNNMVCLVYSMQMFCKSCHIKGEKF